MPLLLLMIFLLLLGVDGLVAGDSPFQLQLHHRFSPKLRQWAEDNGHTGAWWPNTTNGSPEAEYYAALVRHDVAFHARRHGRSLTTADAVYFAGGNATLQPSSRSDLLWVPCDCKQCAPMNQGGFNFTSYTPSASSTSKIVRCSSPLCDPQITGSRCSSPNQTCPYIVQYVSANTYTSGVLVEDLLYLRRFSGDGDLIKAPITFGCGQLQTGALLEEGGAPNGLLGLGFQKISVPSTLAASNVISHDSFSMCFNFGGLGGRIFFGDTGGANLSYTPLIAPPPDT